MDDLVSKALEGLDVAKRKSDNDDKDSSEKKKTKMVVVEPKEEGKVAVEDKPNEEKNDCGSGQEQQE